MSDHDKAFAQFPGTDGTFFFIDIFTIEAIGQSVAPEVGTIFTANHFYGIEADFEILEAAGCQNVAEYAYGIIAQVATAAEAAGRPEVDDEQDGDFDDMVKQALEDPTVG